MFSPLMILNKVPRLNLIGLSQFMIQNFENHYKL